MKKIISHLIRFAITGACLTYALWGVDFSKLLDLLGSFRPAPVLGLACYAMLTMIMPGARLSFLTEKRLGVISGFLAVVLGLGLNNVLPARLGEMAKAFYIKRNGDMSMGRALEAIFWERFSDLNALLCLGVVTALGMGLTAALYPLLGVVGGVWLFLLLVRLSPRTAHALLRLVPMEKLRTLFGEILLLLESKFSFGFMGTLSIYTVAAWIIYSGSLFLGLWWVAGLDLTVQQVLTVFAVATLGFAIPAVPGGMGVYEAAFVLSLGWFGVGKEEAFAVGFLIHMVQYIPSTLLGLSIMALSGFKTTIPPTDKKTDPAMDETST